MWRGLGGTQELLIGLIGQRDTIHVERRKIGQQCRHAVKWEALG